MMKMIKPFVCLAMVMIPGLDRAQGQQAFWNLDFESPKLPLMTNGYWVNASDAIPGWTPYTYGHADTNVVYDGISFGAAMVSLHDHKSLEKTPIAGDYSVFLQSSSGGIPSSSGIGQVGTIPSDAKSLLYWGSDMIQVSFEGSMVPVFCIGTGPAYQVMAADISAYAGLTGELRFTQPYNEILRNMTWLDNIQFSSEAIPEPSTLALLGLGGLATLWISRKKS